MSGGGRLTNGKYKRMYAALVERDGEKCRLCGVTPPTKRMTIEHIDRNPHNNTFSNLAFLCQSCQNRVRGACAGTKAKLFVAASQGNGGQCVREKAQAYSRLTTSAGTLSATKAIANGIINASGEMTISAIIKAQFIAWLTKWLNEIGFITYKDALDAGANECNCSQVTLRRYIEAMSNPINGTIDISDDSDSGKCIILLREGKTS